MPKRKNGEVSKSKSKGSTSHVRASKVRKIQQTNSRAKDTFAASVAAPEEVGNFRTRTDYSAEKSALAEPYLKTEIPFNYQSFTNGVDPSSSIPTSLLITTTHRDPHASFKYWQQNNEPVSWNPQSTIPSDPADADWHYSMVFEQLTNGTNQEGDYLTFTNDVETTGLHHDTKFKGMRFNSDKTSGKPVYDDFQYSMEYGGKRYFYTDSGRVNPTDDTKSYQSLVVFTTSAVVPTNGVLNFTVFNFNEGADSIVGTAQIAAGDDIVTIVLPGEIHDYYRVEVDYMPQHAAAATPTALPANFFYSVDLYGFGSYMQFTNLPGYNSNEATTEELKMTAETCFLSNDNVQLYKNGTVYQAQLPETMIWTNLLVAAQTKGVPGIVTVLTNEDNEKDYNAANGSYAFLKPGSTDELKFKHPWSLSFPLTTGGKQVHVDEWSRFEDGFDWMATIWNVSNVAEPVTNLTARVRNYYNIEFKTNNLWMHKGYADLGPANLQRSLEVLRTMPQFYSNDDHLKKIGGTLKKAGIAGGLIAGAAGQVELLPVAGAVYGAGELLDTIGDLF